ncbi:MAG: SPOR domain-containing protein, partial [Hyphomicrobiaceae bacterium]
STGGLTSNEMARALYFRGLSHRKQGRPAQAISDLTGAIWLADGLDEKDRGAAVAARALAYKDAGLPDPGAPQTAAATAVPAPVPAAPPASHSSAKRAEPAPAADGSWQTSATPRAATVAQAEEPAAAAPSSGGGIAGFFSNLFGGGESSPPAAPSPGNVTTSSTGTPPNSAVSSWSTETAATRAAPAAAPAVKRTRTAAIADSPPPPAPAVAAKPALTGKYKLQVAVVRSRAEADRVLGELTAKHAAKLGARHAVVEEAVFGNMGTFFRVNVGPFATAAESGKVCDALRPGGYDCLVVTQ